MRLFARGRFLLWRRWCAERERIRRHWTVVLLNEPWTDAAEDPYGALGVDLTVNAAAQDILLVQVTDSGLRTTPVEP